MSSDFRDVENYCKDCSRSIYGEIPSCDINIENNGRYVKSGKCYCKVKDGHMAEQYPWELKEE